MLRVVVDGFEEDQGRRFFCGWSSCWQECVEMKLRRLTTSTRRETKNWDDGAIRAG